MREGKPTLIVVSVLLFRIELALGAALTTFLFPLCIYPKPEGVTGKLLMAAHPVIGGTAPDLMVYVLSTENPNQRFYLTEKGRFITSVEQYGGKNQDTASVIGLKYRIENYDCIEIFRCVILSA